MYQEGRNVTKNVKCQGKFWKDKDRKVALRLGYMEIICDFWWIDFSIIVEMLHYTRLRGVYKIRK